RSRTLHHLETADLQGVRRLRDRWRVDDLTLVLRLHGREPLPGAFREFEIVGHRATAHDEDPDVGALIKPVAHARDAEEERLVLLLHVATVRIHAPEVDRPVFPHAPDPG